MANYQDGVLIFGSQAVTIGGYTAVADNINIDAPTKPLTRMDDKGNPVAEVLIDEVVTGSLQLQLKDATTAPPAKGAHFTLADVDGTTLNFKVSKVGRKFVSDGEAKMNIDFRQRFATGA